MEKKTERKVAGKCPLKQKEIVEEGLEIYVNRNITLNVSVSRIEYRNR